MIKKNERKDWIDTPLKRRRKVGRSMFSNRPLIATCFRESCKLLCGKKWSKKDIAKFEMLRKNAMKLNEILIK